MLEEYDVLTKIMSINKQNPSCATLTVCCPVVILAKVQMLVEVVVVVVGVRDSLVFPKNSFVVHAEEHVCLAC
jgi:hypothetical protein